MNSEDLPETILKYYNENMIKKTIVRKDKIIVKTFRGVTDVWSKEKGGWFKDKQKKKLLGGIET